MSLEEKIRKFNELEDEFGNVVKQYTNLLPGLSNSTAVQVETTHAGHKFNRVVKMILDVPLQHGDKLEHVLLNMKQVVNKVMHLTSCFQAWCIQNDRSQGGDIGEETIDCEKLVAELGKLSDKELFTRIGDFSETTPSKWNDLGAIEEIKELMSKEESEVSGIVLASRILEGCLLNLELIIRLKSSEIHAIRTVVGTQANMLAKSFKTGGELIEQVSTNRLCQDTITLNSIKIKAFKKDMFSKDYFFTITLAKSNTVNKKEIIRLPEKDTAPFPQLDNNNEGVFNFVGKKLFERISGSCDEPGFVNLILDVTEVDIKTANNLAKSTISFDGEALKCPADGNSTNKTRTVTVFEDSDDKKAKIAEVTFSIKLTKKCVPIEGV